MLNLNSPELITLSLAAAAILIGVVMMTLRSSKKSQTSTAGHSNSPLQHDQLYVGNLSYRIREGQLRDFFSQYGDIKNIRIIKNHQNGRSKGFGFVTFSDSSEAKTALSTNGEDFCGRPLVVRIAKAR